MGGEAIGWYHLLRPVSGHFVAACDSPLGEENKEFWGRCDTVRGRELPDLSWRMGDSVLRV